jgi:hypothetical protein
MLRFYISNKLATDDHGVDQRSPLLVRVENISGMLSTEVEKA